MSTFSSLLSSIGGPQKVPQQASSDQVPRKPNGLTTGAGPRPSNIVAGVKRKSEEPEPGPRTKSAKTEQNGAASRPTATMAPNRFQLSSKPGAAQQKSGAPQNTPNKSSTLSNTQRLGQIAISKPTSSASPTPPSTANGPPPPKRGFASIMEKAKAAQEAAKAAGASGIKHKPVEKMSKKERIRLREEAIAQQKAAAKSGKPVEIDRSRSGTPVAGKAGIQQKVPETGYQGTMKKQAAPLTYRGTMRAEGIAAAKKEKNKGAAQDKHGGYASWSDLDDAEDEEEDYDSDGSSDMEAGLDDVEKEERIAARAAWLEDKEAMEEEERHRKEKLERKRKLEALSKSAAARKKY